MAKTKFSVKITGLEISFEGDRDDLPGLTRTVGSQVEGLINQPAALLSKPPMRPHQAAEEVVSPPMGKNKVAGGNGAPKRSRKRSKVEPIVWQHDVDRWGQPSQEWNPTKKAIWLLYVAKNESNVNSLTAGQIAATFNHHFIQAGKVLAPNVSRDLKKASQARPPQVQKDTTTGNSPWFLTDAGIKEAEGLVKQCRGIED